MERSQGERRHDRRAISIRDDAAAPTALFALRREHAEMFGIHLGDDQRHIRRHPMVLGVAQDDLAGARECRLTSPATLESRAEKATSESTADGSDGTTGLPG